MTDMVDVAATAARREPARVMARPFALDETYWGYIVRSQSGPHIGIVAAQVVSMFLGAGLIVAALGLWIVPTTLMGEADLMFRGVASILCAAAAVLLLWFSSRGTESELQIDTHQGEVREVIRNRTGRSTLIGRHGFDAVGGVVFEETAKSGTALVLRYRNTSQTLVVAKGDRVALEPLRNRLGRDLMLSQPEAA